MVPENEIPEAGVMWDAVRGLPGNRDNARVHPGFIEAAKTRPSCAELARSLGRAVDDRAKKDGGVNVLFDTIGVPPISVRRAARWFRRRGYVAEELDALIRYDAAGVATSPIPVVVAWLLSQGVRAKVREPNAAETVREARVPYCLNIAWGRAPNRAGPSEKR